MSHHHTHHDHRHNHIPQDRKVLLISFAIITFFMLLEFIGGTLFNSLALIADAGHMANDSLSLGLAALALWLTHKTPRLSQWLALINGSSLLVIALLIIWEAVERLHTPQTVEALPMVALATVGLVVNMIVAKMMMHADQHNLNIRAAYLHVLADLFGSVVAIASGLSIYFFGWQWVDPLASLLLSLIILKSGWQVTKAALDALQH